MRCLRPKRLVEVDGDEGNVFCFDHRTELTFACCPADEHRRSEYQRRGGSLGGQHIQMGVPLVECHHHRDDGSWIGEPDFVR